MRTLALAGTQDARGKFAGKAWHRRHWAVGATSHTVPYCFSVNSIFSAALWKSDCDIEPLLHIPANIIM